jgi:predicted DNA-binding transcriptional regulator AlpA
MSTARLTFPPAEQAADVFKQLLHASGLFTAQELSHILRLSPKTLYSYAERDLIPHFKIETSVRFSGVEVAEWLRSRRHCAHPATPHIIDAPHG